MKMVAYPVVATTLLVVLSLALGTLSFNQEITSLSYSNSLGLVTVQPWAAIDDGWKRDAREQTPKGVKKFGEFIKAEARRLGFDPEWIYSQITTESIWRTEDISGSLAYNLMQVRKPAVDDLKRIGSAPDCTDWKHNWKCNVRYGLAYLAMLRDHYGFKDRTRRFVAYNEGLNSEAVHSSNVKYHPYVVKIRYSHDVVL